MQLIYFLICLFLWQDIEFANVAYDKIAKLVERGDKKFKQEYDTLVKVKDLLENKKQHIRFADWDGKDVSLSVWDGTART